MAISQRATSLINPENHCILLSKSKVVIAQNGICDFYEMRLSERPQHSVVISMRASLGAVSIRPDSLHIKPDDFHVWRHVVVVSHTMDRCSEADELDITHYVTSRAERFDGLSFPLKVFVAEREGGILHSFGSNSNGQLGHLPPAPSAMSYAAKYKSISRRDKGKKKLLVNHAKKAVTDNQNDEAGDVARVDVRDHALSAGTAELEKHWNLK